MSKNEFISQEYAEQIEGRHLKEDTRGKRFFITLSTILFSSAAVIGVGLIAFTMVFFYSPISGPSMMTKINAQWLTEGDTDSVLVRRTDNVRRGDVIILNHYKANGEFKSMHVKRLMAMPGDSICFVPVESENRYDIQVNGVTTDGLYATLYGNNHIGDQYWRYYRWQQAGDYGLDDPRGEYDYAPSRVGDGDALFRATYTDGNGVVRDFRKKVTRGGTERWEIELPSGYFFYMGDNRGGTGVGPISIDSTYFGPQRTADIVGVVVEVVHKKTAPQWFLSKIVYYVTFKSVKI
jgi:signal peptidase I